MDIETHGPFGRKQLPNWNLELENRKSLREVIIYVRNDAESKVACGIEFLVTDPCGGMARHLIGKYEGTKICPHPIVLGKGEYLKQIYGTFFIRCCDNTSNTIYSIGICTNLRNYGPFGCGSNFLATPSWGCHKFETPLLSVDDSIAEIFAYNDPCVFYIHNIGVRIRKGANTCTKTTKDKGKHSASIDILERLDAQDEMMKKMMEAITKLSKKRHENLEKKLDEIVESVSKLTRISRTGFASCSKEEENDDDEEESDENC